MIRCTLDKFSFREKCVFCDHPERCHFQSVEGRNDFTNDVILCIIKNSQKGQYSQSSYSELFEFNSCLSSTTFHKVKICKNYLSKLRTPFPNSPHSKEFYISAFYSAKFEGYLKSEMQGPHRKNGHWKTHTGLTREIKIHELYSI